MLKVWLILPVGTPKSYSSLPNHKRKAVTFQECHLAVCWAGSTTSSACLAPGFMQELWLAPGSGRMELQLTKRHLLGRLPITERPSCAAPSYNIGQYLSTNNVFLANIKKVFALVNITENLQCILSFQCLQLHRSSWTGNQAMITHTLHGHVPASPVTYLHLSHLLHKDIAKYPD